MIKTEIDEDGSAVLIEKIENEDSTQESKISSNEVPMYLPITAPTESTSGIV